MILLSLFLTFFLIGLVSFGGGYAMIPIIQAEAVNRHGWLTNTEFTNVIAIAGMSPGPIATNSAIIIGSGEAGFWGAVVSGFGMVLPSMMIILLIGMMFYKIKQNHLVKSAFYGLRPIITGLIMYSALIFAYNNGMVSSLTWHTWSQIIILIGSLTALLYFRLHPVYVILLSGLVGIAVYA
ncbi:MAG: chromate transporter [Paenibacillaceae bacterium]